MSVSIDNMRPAEYWQQDSEEYDMIRELKAVYRQAVADDRAKSGNG